MAAWAVLLVMRPWRCGDSYNEYLFQRRMLHWKLGWGRCGLWMTESALVCVEAEADELKSTAPQSDLSLSTERQPRPGHTFGS